MKDVEYIALKLKHCKRIGINAKINPETGACQTEFNLQDKDERDKRYRLRQKRGLDK